MQFQNAMIYTEKFRFEHGAFAVENGRFARVLGQPGPDAVDLHGAYVIPGLLDIHTHGNSGADYSDGNWDDYVRMARYSARNGITSIAPTTLTLPYETLAAAFATAYRMADERPAGCAVVRGAHMEGPFFSEKKRARRTPPISVSRTLRRSASSLPPATASSASWTSHRSCPVQRNLCARQASSVPSPSRTRTRPMTMPSALLKQVSRT